MTEPSPPALEHYNQRASALGIRTGSGLPLRFVLPDTLELGYERRAFERGEVVTRADNWHDAFNAEVWLEFPRSKSLLNRLHVEALAAEQPGRRGRTRDRLTQFDECGVLITGLPEFLWQALCAHRWTEVFVAHRSLLVEKVRFHYVGHATRDALRAPFFGLCGKALWLDGEFADACALDEALNRRLASADLRNPWPPLPLLGIPGVVADNEDPAYYDDHRQFRPARRMGAGSPPGNR